MRLHILCEDKPGSVFRRFLDMVKGKPGFGRGVDPKNWGEVEEIVDAYGVPRIDYEAQMDKARALEDKNLKKALEIYKGLIDKHPLSGLRQKSYFKRSVSAGDHLFVVIDIDNLKHLNSKLGHAGADTVLRTFGELLEHHLENRVNDVFGKISKTFHRSGDEFNVIITVDDQNIKDVVAMVYNESQKLLDKFSRIEFRSKLGGKARATATIGISFDEKQIDRTVDKIKNRRRRPQLGGDMPHLIVGDDVKDMLPQTHPL